MRVVPDKVAPSAHFSFSCLRPFEARHVAANVALGDLIIRAHDPIYAMSLGKTNENR
jgi:hypothetical protein